MSHIVIYRSPDGKPGYHQVDELAEAISYVEGLRNEQGVQDSRIYRLEQVGFRFETYYHVRVEGEAVPPPPVPESTASWSTPAAPAPQATPAAPPVAEAAVAPRLTDATTAPAAPSAATSAVDQTSDGASSETSEGDLADVDSNGVRRGLFGR